MRYLMVAVAFVAGIACARHFRVAADKLNNRVMVRIPPSMPTAWAPRFRTWEHGQEVSYAGPTAPSLP